MKKTTKITTQRAVTTIRRRAPTYQKLLKISTLRKPSKKCIIPNYGAKVRKNPDTRKFFEEKIQKKSHFIILCIIYIAKSTKIQSK